MEITGKVIQLMPIQKGVSAFSGKEWQLMTFIIETQEQYPKKIAVEVFGEEKIKSTSVMVDDVVTASIDIESREFNGRWYTSVRAWKVAKADEQASGSNSQPTQQEQAAQSQEPAQPVESVSDNVQPDSGESEEDLPF